LKSTCPLAAGKGTKNRWPAGFTNRKLR